MKLIVMCNTLLEYSNTMKPHIEIRHGLRKHDMVSDVQIATAGWKGLRGYKLQD